MGSASKEKMEDYKDKFSNVFVRPCIEYLKYVVDFYTRLFTGSPKVGEDGYIEGLSEYLAQEFFTSYDDVYIKDAQQYNIHAYSYSTATASYQGLEDIHIYTFQSMKSERVHIIYTSSGYMFCLDNGDSVNISCSIKWHHKYNDWKTWNTSSWLMSYVPPNHNCTFSANIPIYPSHEVWKEALQSGDYSSALNYGKSMDAIAIPGDDIPTVGNWEDLWERLKK